MRGVRPGALLGHTPGLWTPPGAVASGASAFTTAVLADNPAAYWRFGDASGSPAVDLVAANNLVAGSAPTPGQAGWTSDGNTAFSFNGTTNVIQTATPPSVAIDNFAIECVLKLPSLTNQLGLAVKNGIGTNGWGIGIGDGLGAAGLKLIGLYANVGWIQTNYTFADLNYHHCIITREAGTTKAYVDGVAVSVTAGAALVPIAPSGRCSAGAEDSNGAGAWTRFYGGIVDEPAIYNGALTAARAAAHFAAR